MIGHFTALVWDTTTEVGFGFACGAETSSSSGLAGYACYAVANYLPVGNIQGQNLQHVQPLKMSCSITNCTTCNGSSLCSVCDPGYNLSLTQTACNPICNDSFCTNCLTPGTCGNCSSGYIPVNGICTIDCAQNAVSNCLNCTTLTTCSGCNPGYTLILNGTYCNPTCNDTNCQICSSSAAGSCTICKIGYT